MLFFSRKKKGAEPKRRQWWMKRGESPVSKGELGAVASEVTYCELRQTKENRTAKRMKAMEAQWATGGSGVFFVWYTV